MTCTSANANTCDAFKAASAGMRISFCCLVGFHSVCRLNTVATTVGPVVVGDAAAANLVDNTVVCGELEI
jgi:hypothetical protein